MKNLKLALALWMIGSWAFAQSPSYVFVFLHKRTDKAEMPADQLKKIMDGHLANIGRLAKEDKLVAAGPFDGGGGIFIFNSTSVEEVSAWLQTDPGVQAQRWRVEMLPYYTAKDAICKATEPYEMVTYQFIRFVPYMAKDNMTQQADLFRKHDDYIHEISKNGNMVTQGTFGNTDGGILILKNPLEPELIAKDPAVSNGLLEADIKKLWIARGSFCEK